MKTNNSLLFRVMRLSNLSRRKAQSFINELEKDYNELTPSEQSFTDYMKGINDIELMDEIELRGYTKNEKGIY